MNSVFCAKMWMTVRIVGLKIKLIRRCLKGQ